MSDVLKSMLTSFLILSPSLLLWVYLMGNQVYLPYPYLVVYAILFWAVLDFIIVIRIELYRPLGALTIPAFIGVISTTLFYVIAESINRFFEKLGYEYLTPVVAIAVLLICVATFREKNVVLKVYLSLNIMMLAALWVLGNTNKIMLPF